MKKRNMLLALLIAVLLLLTGCMAVPKGQQPGENYRLGEDVWIEGVEVSRMKISAAREKVKQAVTEEINALNYSFSLEEDEKNIKVKGEELPIRADIEAALREASYLTQYRPIGHQKRQVQVPFYLEEGRAGKLVERIVRELTVAPTDAKAVYDTSVEGAFVYEEGVPGRRAEEDVVLSKLRSAVENKQGGRITLPFIKLQPQYTVEHAMKDHLPVAVFTTSYAKSPHNAAGRVFNIEKAASLIDGVTLQPGEEFDMNEILGPRTEETGWRTAPGIRDGKYEQEYGGGVCQVSSTLFNAVLMADLTVTERRPHSWPLTYVPIGRDATISTGGPNFKFVNSSESEVVISAITQQSKKITVTIYGRPLAEGVTIKVSSKQTGTLPAAGTEVLLDKSLPAGTTKEDRQERRGKTSATYKEYYDANGEFLKKELAFEDTYRSIKGRVYVSEDLYTQKS